MTSAEAENYVTRSGVAQVASAGSHGASDPGIVHLAQFVDNSTESVNALISALFAWSKFQSLTILDSDDKPFEPGDDDNEEVENSTLIGLKLNLEVLLHTKRSTVNMGGSSLRFLASLERPVAQGQVRDLVRIYDWHGELVVMHSMGCAPDLGATANESRVIYARLEEHRLNWLKASIFGSLATRRSIDSVVQFIDIGMKDASDLKHLIDSSFAPHALTFEGSRCCKMRGDLLAIARCAPLIRQDPDGGDSAFTLETVSLFYDRNAANARDEFTRLIWKDQFRNRMPLLARYAINFLRSLRFSRMVVAKKRELTLQALELTRRVDEAFGERVSGENTLMNLENMISQFRADSEAIAQGSIAQSDYRENIRLYAHDNGYIADQLVEAAPTNSYFGACKADQERFVIQSEAGVAFAQSLHRGIQEKLGLLGNKIELVRAHYQKAEERHHKSLESRFHFLELFIVCFYTIHLGHIVMEWTNGESMNYAFVTLLFCFSLFVASFYLIKGKPLSVSVRRLLRQGRNTKTSQAAVSSGVIGMVSKSPKQHAILGESDNEETPHFLVTLGCFLLLFGAAALIAYFAPSHHSEANEAYRFKFELEFPHSPVPHSPVPHSPGHRQSRSSHDKVQDGQSKEKKPADAIAPHDAHSN